MIEEFIGRTVAFAFRLILDNSALEIHYQLLLHFSQNLEKMAKMQQYQEFSVSCRTNLKTYRTNTQLLVNSS